MSDKQKHLEDLSHIRNLMERSSRFISLSGLSGVFAGIFALLGAFAALKAMTGNYQIMSYGNRLPFMVTTDLLFFIVLDALAVLVLSFSAAVFFTTRKAKKQGLALWDEKAFRMLVNMAIPLVAGGIFCLILMYHSLKVPAGSYRIFALIAPSTLVFYGLALLNASNYTLDEIKWLGISEIILGLIACVFLGYGLLFWMLGFGVLHIVYGFIMWNKYERRR
ncbi:MAG: hypothetical protein R2772_11235 [Chitinophagales bacterium]